MFFLLGILWYIMCYKLLRSDNDLYRPNETQGELNAFGINRFQYGPFVLNLTTSWFYCCAFLQFFSIRRL